MVTNGILLPQFWIRGDLTEARIYDFGTWLERGEILESVTLEDPDQEVIIVVEMIDHVLCRITITGTTKHQTELVGFGSTNIREFPINIVVINPSPMVPVEMPNEDDMDMPV